MTSLPDEEYKTFVLTLVNGKASLRYNDVSIVLVNNEVRRNDKKSSSSSTITGVLTERGIGSNHRKGEGDVGRLSKAQEGEGSKIRGKFRIGE